MATRTPSALRCSCRSASTSTNSTTTASGNRTRVVASLLLSRPPLVLPPLSAFEKAHYAYNQQLKAALSDTFQTTTYFAKGSQAERTFLEQQAEKQKQLKKGAQDVVGPDPEVKSESDGVLASLERKQDRTLYLLLRKERKQGEKGAWQFPQGSVEASDESLAKAAVRELHEEVGPNLDLFLTSRVPASAFSYSLPSSSAHAKSYDQTKAFLMPARVLRGQAKVSEQGSKEGIKEFAWLTREEVQQRVEPSYWQEALKQGELLAQ